MNCSVVRGCISNAVPIIQKVHYSDPMSSSISWKILMLCSSKQKLKLVWLKSDACKVFLFGVQSIPFGVMLFF